MYTADLRTSSPSRSDGAPRAIAWLDLVALALALPVFLIGGFPIAGYLVGALAWLAQRGVQVVVGRRVAATQDPRAIVGMMAGSMIARGWMVALAILLVGLSDNGAGLGAAILVIALFTIYFTARMVLRPFEETRSGT